MPRYAFDPSGNGAYQRAVGPHTQARKPHANRPPPPQANIKQQNRRCEAALRLVEAVLVAAAFPVDPARPPLAPHTRRRYQGAIRSLWKDLLLNQFHDVLPGSAIGMVYEDSDRMLTHVLGECRRLSSEILRGHDNSNDNKPGAQFFNATSFAQTIWVRPAGGGRDGGPHPAPKRLFVRPFEAVAVPHGAWQQQPAAAAAPHASLRGIVSTRECTGLNDHVCPLGTPCHVAIENSVLTVTLCRRCGALLSLVDKRCGREVVDAAHGGFGNRLMLYDDVPFYWDAWDTFPYHLHTGAGVNGPHATATATTATATTSTSAGSAGSAGPTFGDGLGSGGVVIELSDPDKGYTITQRISLTADSPILLFDTHVDWRARHRLLKVKCPYRAPI